jgi:hypothetical protein
MPVASLNTPQITSLAKAGACDEEAHSRLGILCVLCDSRFGTKHREHSKDKEHLFHFGLLVRKKGC